MAAILEYIESAVTPLGNIASACCAHMIKTTDILFASLDPSNWARVKNHE